jgi:LmbE family N-acetylglucosaminyl deacetylase
MSSVLAIAAHPDDIEFLMAGTLLLLRAAGWETHYFNIARGNLGSLKHPQARIAAIRRRKHGPPQTSRRNMACADLQ